MSVPEPRAPTPDGLRRRIAAAIASRVSPERTRRATVFEQLTVQRLPWDTVVRLNRYLEVTGKLATAIWVAFIGSVVFGVEWRDIVEDAVNSGRPLENALLFAVGIPTAVFLLARSMIGFAAGAFNANCGVATWNGSAGGMTTARAEGFGRAAR